MAANMSKKVTTLENEEATCELAREMAGQTRAGDIFLLKGELGAGKTVFSRAFINHFLDTEVPSPTFTLLQTYHTDKFDIYHLDLYRLKHAGEIIELGIEDAVGQAVMLIEWPEIAENIIKDIAQRKGRIIEITFSYGNSKGNRKAEVKKI